MSSFVGHASVGVAVFLSQSRLSLPAVRLGLPACVLLAIAPDFDYLAYWLFHITVEPRWTHSLLFALAARGCVWLSLRTGKSAARELPWTALMAAAGSHMLLDLLVNVHPVPVLWPGPQWMSPIGLLPSAGRIDPGNYYFWRNLLIECGVLMPVLALWVSYVRRLPVRRLGAGAVVLVPLWIGAVAWSLRIH